jgi:hypothetical protein
MNYFVSLINNSPAYQWQMELLIESFKKHHIEDNLYIAIAPEEFPYHYENNFNILRHQKIYGYENIGKKRGYEPLNSLYFLSWSISSGKIKQPFTLLQPDMILYEPFEPSLAGGYAEVLFMPDHEFSFEEAAEIGPFWEWFSKSKDFYQENWTPIGSLMAFSEMPQDFFYNVVLYAEKLLIMQVSNNKKVWKYTIKLAWVLAFAEYAGKFVCRGDYSLVMPLLGSGNSPFICYDKGIPPYFHNSMYISLPPDYFALGNPIETLSKLAFSPNTYYVSQIAQDCLNKRK